jgi:phosphate-selective porin OprO and OprP
MIQKGKLSFGIPILIAVTLFSSPTQAQQGKEQVQEQQGREQVQPSPAEGAKVESQDKPDLSQQVEQLSTKVQQLQLLIEQQQQTLANMSKRLAETEEKRGTLAADAATPNDPVGAPAKAANALNAQPEADRSLADAKSTAPTAQPVQNKEQSKTTFLAGWDDNHAFLRNADGSFVTNLIGYAQLDFRGYQVGNHPPNTFLLRRARLGLEGKIARYYDFKIEGDFADPLGSILRDVYVRVHRWDEFQVTAGHFKEPFSQEELRSDAYQDFVERSLVNIIAPSRSPGAMMSGVLRDGTVEYQLGAFNGKGPLAVNTNGTPEGVGRLRFYPWKNTKQFWLNGLAFGGAYALGRSASGLSVRGQTESRSFTYYSPVPVNGAQTRANGEFTWLLGPATVRAEYDQEIQARNGLGPEGTALPAVVSKGYMGQFTYLLTGEKKPDSGPVSPKNILFGGENGSTGFGAWELAFRYSNLQISDGTPRSNRAETFYFGVNWYLNRFVRYMLDFGLERYKDPLRTPKPNDKDFFVVLSRMQFAF